MKSNRYESIDYFKYFSVLLQEMDINLDETFLVLLLQFFHGNDSETSFFWDNKETNDE